MPSNRSSGRGPLLGPLILVLVSCGGDLPPFQMVPIEGPAEMAGVFRGTWYDFEGVPVVTVDGRPDPTLRVRAPDGSSATRAAVGPLGLHVWFEVAAETGEVVFRIGDDPDVMWAGPPDPDARPSGCGWAALIRNPSLADRVETQVSKLAQTCSAVKQTTTDWLVDHF